MPTPDPKQRLVSATAYDEVDLLALEMEISQDPAITIAVQESYNTATTFTVVFKDTLPAADETAFDAVVAAHIGEPLIIPETVRLDAPREPDGKPVIVTSPAPEGMLTFFTGRGDEPVPTPPETGRGNGAKIKLTFATSDTYPADKEAEWSYNESTWVHDGEVTWRDAVNCNADDHFSVALKMPATVVTPNGGTTGNCNLVPIGGGANLIVPAAGDGTHDVDLEAAVPVPSPYDPNGYWDVDERAGTLTPSTKPGKASWNLLTMQVVSYFARGIPMHHPLGVFAIDVYKVEWISAKWSWVLKVHKEAQPAADVTVSGWIMLYRENTT